MDLLAWLIGVPGIAGLLCLFLPRRVRVVREALAVLASAACVAVALLLRARGAGVWLVGGSEMLAFRYDGLSGLAVLGCAFFALAVSVYSVGYMRGGEAGREYWGYLLWTLAASVAAATADNIWLLAVSWGLAGLLLYLLVGTGGPAASTAAKKTLIIVGGTDAAMLLGLAVLAQLSGSQRLFLEAGRVPLAGSGAVAAYLLILSAVLAKAGALPLHTWVPDVSECAPAPVAAYLPASLDKLLGIYLLARVSLHSFALGPGISVVLMGVGAATILASVMMALVQHDMKRLLGYHAVSQVGYMVLGIGTLNPVGIAGGLFHMVNHALYKSSLFLGAGSVEKRAGTTDLHSLGGLARGMPVTFAAFLVGALAISGVPPLNGFASKWLVYQGLVELSASGGRLWVVFLAAATLGSALTLASFAKLLHAVFLGPRTEREAEGSREVREVGPSMWLPHATLAALCVLFGVAAYRLPLAGLIQPAVGADVRALVPGFWSPGLATWLILLGLVLGGVVLAFSRSGRVREDATFVGGEEMPPSVRPTGVDFYATLSDARPLAALYEAARRGYFDLYAVGKALALYFAEGLRSLHRGLLPTYVLWCVAGLVFIAMALGMNR